MNLGMASPPLVRNAQSVRPVFTIDVTDVKVRRGVRQGLEHRHVTHHVAAPVLRNRDNMDGPRKAIQHGCDVGFKHLGGAQRLHGLLVPRVGTPRQPVVERLTTGEDGLPIQYGQYGRLWHEFSSFDDAAVLTGPRLVPQTILFQGYNMRSGPH